MFDSKKYYIGNREKILKYSKEYSKIYRKNNREKIKEYKIKYKKNNREKIREYERRRYKKRGYLNYHKGYYQRRKYIQDYKLSKGCVICGYNKCAEALDFHHPNNNRIFKVSNVHNKKFEKIKKEIDKCIVLCSNCHRELHAKGMENNQDT